jgi:hypothetical protein
MSAQPQHTAGASRARARRGSVRVLYAQARMPRSRTAWRVDRGFRIPRTSS